jgi:arginase
VCVTTLPAVLRHRPDASVVWIDAHADFNTPATTPSDYLGGMGLAAACGLWDAGLRGDGPVLDPGRVVMCGMRDVDGGEQVLLETRGVHRIRRPSMLAGAVAGRSVFVHLDLDVLDPAALPGTAFPVAGGLSAAGLRALLAAVATAADVVGCEVTGLPTAAQATAVADLLDPLIPRDA